MDKLPDRPVLISGACGGPFVIYLCTPMRNALTLGSQDRSSRARALFGKVFRGGPSAGWLGGRAPAVVACPQFLALGPVYHTLHKCWRDALGVQQNDGHRMLPSFFAAIGAGFIETLLTFGSQSRNAQMAYNNSFVVYSSIAEGERMAVPLNRPYQIWGAGAMPMYIRNIASVTSVRTMSPKLQEHADFITPVFRPVACDVVCSVSVCSITAPVGQLFNFMVTTPYAARAPAMERCKMAREFLYRQYFVPLPRKSSLDPQVYSWRISNNAARDFGMRTLYVTSVFTIYMTIERTLCSLMR